MNNENVQSLRRLGALLPLLGAMALAGCASAPAPQEEAAPPPAAETSPLVQQPQSPAEMQPAPETTQIVLQPHHPTRYVVVKGDTLWEIAGRFLRDPWRWPEVWQGNPQVANPHLIYPGDVLVLMMVNGKPVIQPEGVETPATSSGGGATASATQAPPPIGSSGQRLKVVKLSPRVRVEDLTKAIPTIPMDAIRQFLDQSVVATRAELDNAPYIVAFPDEHVAGGSGFRAYVRGLKEGGPSAYMVVHSNKEYRDPDTGEFLGYEALYLANANVTAIDETSTVMLSDAKREVMKGDRLLPGRAESFNHSFMPQAPLRDVKGKIISAFDAISQFAQHQVVVLNLGKREGMEPGDVLAVFEKGERIKDEVEGGSVRLPNERSGLVMIFRTFDKVSYALVMRSTRTMHVGDMVQNP